MNKEQNKIRFLSGTAMSTVVAIAGLAIAPGVVAQPSSSFEEITVTARKKEENLLETPIAITAFGSQQIESLGLEDIGDIQLFTPGFVYEAFGSTPGRNDQTPRFRGVGIDTSSPLRQTASVFVDGVFVVNSASGIALNDIERVEVIKGPQSAFFGRNTFGGAVNYISKTPGDEFQADISASIAQHDDFEISGSIEGAISDIANARLSAYYHDDGGHYTNAGGLGEELGEEETFGISGTLFLEPTERFSAKLRASYFENDDGAPAVVPLNSDQHNCGPFGGVTTAYCGTLPFSNSPSLGTDIDAKEDPDNYRQSLAEIYETLGFSGGRDEFGFQRESLTLTADLSFDINDNITFSSLTGYNDEESSYLNDWDETNIPEVAGFDQANARRFESFSQEFRLSGSSLGDRLDWSIGINYFDQEFESFGDFLLDQPAIFGGFYQPGDRFGGTPDREVIETLGIFGSLIYRLNDQLSLTFEGRNQKDEVTEDGNTDDTDPGLSGEFTNNLPRVIVDYTPWDSTLFYLSYSVGNLPGNFNSNFLSLTDDERAVVRAVAPAVDFQVEEEELESWELGIKHRFADGRGSISAAIFSMERTNIITRVSVIQPDLSTDSFNINAGDADIRGLELEGSYQILDNLRVEGSYGYLDNEFGESSSTPQLRLRGDDSLDGLEAARFPGTSGSLSLVTDNEMSNGNSWFARLDTNYIGERFAGDTNTAIVDSGVVANLRAGIVTEKARYEVFMKNLTDEDTPTGARQGSDGSIPSFGGFSIFGYNATLRDRRQVGARVSFNF